MRRETIDLNRGQTPSAEEASRARLSLKPLLTLKPLILAHKGALWGAVIAVIVSAVAMLAVPMAVRRMMHILEEKGHLRRREQGREVVYAPRQTKTKAGRRALEQVLETFFGGSLEEALAAHLHSKKDQVSAEELQRLKALIEQAEQEGR